MATCAQLSQSIDNEFELIPLILLALFMWGKRRAEESTEENSFLLFQLIVIYLRRKENSMVYITVDAFWYVIRCLCGCAGLCDKVDCGCSRDRTLTRPFNYYQQYASVHWWRLLWHSHSNEKLLAFCALTIDVLIDIYDNKRKVEWKKPEETCIRTASTSMKPNGRKRAREAIQNTQYAQSTVGRRVS